MKNKVKIGLSFYCLVIICILTNNLLLMLNYFVALLIHELSHLFVAAGKGYKLTCLHLTAFGFSISLDESIEDKDGFLINIAGASVNLLICLICVCIYWFVPISYVYLNSFCVANLCLAVFNLLPIYPLDGGKIIKAMFKNKKTYFTLDCIIKVIFFIVFVILFIFSSFVKINYIYLLLAIFFVFLNKKQVPSLNLLKKRANKKFDKIVLIKVTGQATLLETLKLVNAHHFTIFYCNEFKTKYFDEDELIEFSTNNAITTQLRNLKVK